MRWDDYLKILQNISLRYFYIAGIAFVLGYVLLRKWINTSVNHNLHHQYFKGNYGLYFLFWDRMMGTIRSDYDERFEEVKTRSRIGLQNDERSVATEVQ